MLFTDNEFYYNFEIFQNFAHYAIGPLAIALAHF